MKLKVLRENLKMGNVLRIEIEKLDNVEVYITLRQHLFRYKLERDFSSINSAVNILAKAIDNPIYQGLTPQYMAIPPINIQIFERSKKK